jgi:hypothetical protein
MMEIEESVEKVRRGVSVPQRAYGARADWLSSLRRRGPKRVCSKLMIPVAQGGSDTVRRQIMNPGSGLVVVQFSARIPPIGVTLIDR